MALNDINTTFNGSNKRIFNVTYKTSAGLKGNMKLILANFKSGEDGKMASIQSDLTCFSDIITHKLHSNKSVEILDVVEENLRKNYDAASKNTRRNSQYEQKAVNLLHAQAKTCTTGEVPPLILRKREYDGEIIEEWVIDNERKDHYTKPIMSSKGDNDWTLEMVQCIRDNMTLLVDFYLDLYFFYSSQYGTTQLLIKMFENKNRTENIASSMKRMNSMSIPSKMDHDGGMLLNTNISDHEYMMTAIKLYKINNPAELTKAEAKLANITSKFICSVLLKLDLTVVFQILLKRLNNAPPSQAVTKFLDVAIDAVASKFMPEYMKQPTIDKLKTALKSSEFSKVTNVLLNWMTIIVQRRNTFVLPSTSDNMSTIDIKKIFTHSRNCYDLYYFICKTPLKFKPEQTEFYTFMTFSAQNKNYIFDVIQYTNNYKLKCPLDEMSWYQRLELAKSIKTTDDIVITVNPITIDEINFDKYPSGVMGTYYIRTVGTGYGTLFVKYPAENNRKRSANTSSMLNKRHKKQKFQDMVPGIANKELMMNQSIDEHSLRLYNNNPNNLFGNNLNLMNNATTNLNNSTFTNNTINPMLNPFSMYLANQMQSSMDYQSLQQQQFQQAVQQALYSTQLNKQQSIWSQPQVGYLQPTVSYENINSLGFHNNNNNNNNNVNTSKPMDTTTQANDEDSENNDNGDYKDYGEMNLIKQSESGNHTKVILNNF